jgi:hypothetical protein
MALMPEAGGPVVGCAGKTATCLSMGEKELGEKGNRMVVGVFLWRLNGAAERKREGQGGPGSAPHGGQEWGRERGPQVR